MSARIRYLLPALAAALLFLLTFAQAALSATIYVGPSETFTTIQAAIDDAGTNNGDTLIVRDGVYTENVDVNKELTIQSQDWVDNGQNDSATVAGAVVTDHVFEVTASHVTIEGFSIYGGGSLATIKAGIHLGLHVEHCRIANNRCGWDGSHLNYYGIEVNHGLNHTISNNACRHNAVGIRMGGGEMNTVANNIFSDNSYGIWLSSSDSNVIVSNTCASNSSYGIFLSTSDDNTLSLNGFSNNTTGNVGSSGSANTWTSPSEILYDYSGGSWHRSFLGNYYSDRTGNDDNHDGIGSQTYTTDKDNDPYPLWQAPENYSIQAAWLRDDGKMYWADMGGTVGAVAILGGASQIWIAEEAVQRKTVFSGQYPWSGLISFTSDPADLDTLTVQIGSSTNGTDFSPGGPQAILTGDGTTGAFPYETNISAFTIPAGRYLALRITNNSASTYNVRTGGAWSYTSADLQKGPAIPSLPLLLTD